MTVVENTSVALDIARVPAEDLVLVVGSGVSSVPPSGLPTGAELREKLLKDLMRCAAKVLPPLERDRLKSAIVECSIPVGSGDKAKVHGVPFEGLLDIHRHCFPASDRIETFLRDNLVGGLPNAAHAFLAAGLLASPPLFPRVVTLNYDELIEEARPGAHWQRIRVTTETEQDAWRANPTALLFKLHGSFHVPDSIVATLSAERGLAGWKRKLLREVVRDKTLVMVGYSGFDFDVCPMLVESKPRYVYWNTYKPDEKPSDEAMKLLGHGRGRHIFGDVMEFFEAIRGSMASGSSVPAVGPPDGERRSTRGMTLSEGDALYWLVRITVEAGVGDLALKLIQGFRDREPARSDDFLLLRDEGRAHFLIDHTPSELQASRKAYQRAIQRAPSATDAANVWLDYHEPCRLGLKYEDGPIRKAASGVRMFRALMTAWVATAWRRGEGMFRLRGYAWLRSAQVLENLARQTGLARWSWLRLSGSSLTRYCLSRAEHWFEFDDNYFGSLQTERIRLRVSSAPQPDQMRAAWSMRDYYHRLGYLTGWSNSNRDVIDVMKKGDLDPGKARELAQEALAVSALAGDRPGMSKAKELLAALR